LKVVIVEKEYNADQKKNCVFFLFDFFHVASFGDAGKKNGERERKKKEEKRTDENGGIICLIFIINKLSN
jgi:hypothetical protein